LQSYPTTVSNERIDILGASKHTLTLLHIVKGQDPQLARSMPLGNSFPDPCLQNMSRVTPVEDAELRDLEQEISELRSTKKELLEKARPINEELQRVARLERERVDKLHHLRAAKHDREKHQQTLRRLVELESELQLLKCEKDKLKGENAQRTDTNLRLRQSLDQAAKYSKLQRQKILELNGKISSEQELAKARAVGETAESNTVAELRKRLTAATKLLSETREELYESRLRLSDVQERLTVAEQVTAATQQRVLQEADNCDELQLELTSQHLPSTHTGLDFTSYRSYIHHVSLKKQFDNKVVLRRV